MTPEKHFWLRINPLAASCLITLFCLLVACIITSLGVWLAGSPNLSLGLTLTAISALLLAPPLTYGYLVLLRKLSLANNELSTALHKVKELSGLLPICASCKSIRNDAGYWQEVEAYIQDHSSAQFTHSICPICSKDLKQELETLKLPLSVAKPHNRL